MSEHDDQQPEPTEQTDQTDQDGDLAAPGDDPTDEDAVDEASKLSFPTSDPPATWAGSDEKPE